jgi:hypothetical protein
MYEQNEGLPEIVTSNLGTKGGSAEDPHPSRMLCAIIPRWTHAPCLDVIRSNLTADSTYVESRCGAVV